jgi:hypothetical protein
MKESDRVHIKGIMISAGAVIVAALITGYCATRKNVDTAVPAASLTPAQSVVSLSPVPSATPIHYESFFDLNDPYPKPYKAFKIGMRISEIKSLFQMLKQNPEVDSMLLQVRPAEGPFDDIKFYHHGDEIDPRIYKIVYRYRDGENVKTQLMEDAKSSFTSDKIVMKGLNTIFEWPLDNLKVEIDSYAYEIRLKIDPIYSRTNP